MRILIADDQKEIRMLMQQHLESRGHLVVAAANGEEALQALQRQSFDVIFLDEEMPVMSGTQALQAIRSGKEDRAHSIVIALTGYNTEPDRERLLRAGFDFVIGKPFRMDALLAMLQGPIQKDAMGAAALASLAPPVATADDLLKRVGGDPELLRRMIHTFLRNAPKQLEQIRKAIRQKRSDRVAFCAHALKGPLGIFGARKAAERCQELEKFGQSGSLADAGKRYNQLKEEIAVLEANLRGYAGLKRPPGPGAQPKTKRQNRGSKRKKP
ncbi:MAG TPA: response regulator [Candidatus Sulfotelmatobacter sp.]|nr:response regulator [Candidatus Sulfotelmatobacter sp.]